jgi:hypothetical protein
LLGSSSMPEPKERSPTAQPPRARPKALPPAVHTAGTLSPVIRATKPPSLCNFSSWADAFADAPLPPDSPRTRAVRTDELVAFYQEHAPVKVTEVDSLLSTYSTTDIANSLKKKYGAVPQGWEVLDFDMEDFGSPLSTTPWGLGEVRSVVTGKVLNSIRSVFAI